MKKLAASIISLLLVCALLACSSTSVSIPKDYKQYSVDDSLTISVPNDWELMDQEVMDAVVESVIEEDIADKVYIPLTFSIPLNSWASNLNVQRSSDLGKIFTMELLETSRFQSSIINQSKEGLANLGFETEVTGDYGMRTYGNQSFFAVQLTSKKDGLEIYQITAMTVVNEVYYNITISVLLENSDYAEEIMPEILSYLQWN